MVNFKITWVALLLVFVALLNLDFLNELCFLIELN